MVLRVQQRRWPDEVSSRQHHNNSPMKEILMYQSRTEVAPLSEAPFYSVNKMDKYVQFGFDYTALSIHSRPIFKFKLKFTIPNWLLPEFGCVPTIRIHCPGRPGGRPELPHQTNVKNKGRRRWPSHDRFRSLFEVSETLQNVTVVHLVLCLFCEKS